MRIAPHAQVVCTACIVLGFVALVTSPVGAEEGPQPVLKPGMGLPEPRLPDAKPVEATGAAAHEIEGWASWYGGKFQGRLTANGEVFDTTQFTAAHKTLPFGTMVRVTHTGNQKTVTVRINDRGPFVEGRIIDLSRAAADALEMSGEGIAPVELTIISMPEPPQRSIQVASFSARPSAESLQQRLIVNDLDAEIEIHEPDAGTSVFRVVVQRVQESEIDGVVAKLASLGFESVLVRSR